MQLRPYSDNVIFLDTEFSSLDPYVGELLSVGMVTMSGEEFYVEIEHTGKVNEFVKEHVFPYLAEEKVSREEASKRIRKFVGDGNPYSVSYVNPYDSLYLYKLLGVDNTPFFWIPIDFASMLFAAGLQPGDAIPGQESLLNLAESKNIDTSQYREHHALDDAKLLREIYVRMCE